MIKNFSPLPYEGSNPLPAYVNSDLKEYTLLGEVAGSYIITLAKITIGESLSQGKPLTHVLFESFTNHGVRSAVSRTRVSGIEREFTAIKNAMCFAGVEFYSVPPCSVEDILKAFGEYFIQTNESIIRCFVMSQKRP